VIVNESFRAKYWLPLTAREKTSLDGQGDALVTSWA